MNTSTSKIKLHSLNIKNFIACSNSATELDATRASEFLCRRYSLSFLTFKIQRYGRTVWIIPTDRAPSRVDMAEYNEALLDGFWPYYEADQW